MNESQLRMDSIEQMIQRLCPEGVEYRKLGEVCEMQRGTSATRRTLNEGNIPVISGGMQPAYYCDKANREGETITVAGSGANAGYLMYWNEPIFVCDAFSIKSREGICTKYIYHALKNMQGKIYDTKKGGGVPHVHISSIEDFLIPVPPMEVQRRVAEVLDKFTELEAELEAELDCRRRQYSYYRDKLLSFNEIGGGTQSVTWKKMSEIGTFYRGTSFQKKHFVEHGIPCIHYGQIYTHYGTSVTETLSFVSPDIAKNKKLAKTGDLVIATTSENVEDVGKAVAWLGESDIVVSNDACFFRHEQNPKYMAYLIQSKLFFDFKKRNCTGTKVIRINPNAILDFLIPIPSLAEQERIVSILDRFEALTTDLQEGLPAEIAARRKQYEHYRDRLLTFKRKTA